MIKKQNVLFLISLFAVGTVKTMNFDGYASDSESTIGYYLPDGVDSENDPEPSILYNRYAHPYVLKGYVFAYRRKIYSHIGRKEGRNIVAVAQAKRINCLANMSNKPRLAVDAWDYINEAHSGRSVAQILNSIELDRKNRNGNRAHGSYW